MMSVYVSNETETRKFMQNIPKAINMASGNLVDAMTNRGKKIVQTGALGQGGAPKGISSGSKALRNAVIKRVFKANKLGYLKIKSDQIQKAMENEFNISGERYVAYKDNPALREWAIAKGFNPKARGMTVGGKGTYLGTLNKFWEPMFIRLNKETQQIMAQEIEKSFNKLLKSK